MSDRLEVDCRGLTCPQPLINTKEALAVTTGALLVKVDNMNSATNVRRYAEGQGAIVEVEQKGDDFHLSIEPAGDTLNADELPIGCPSEVGESVVAFIASEGMVSGDDGLGAVLMEAFLDTLSQASGTVTHAIFVNAGAKLTIEGSPILDQLCQLEEAGVEVLVCSTCLNHYGITDKLIAGSVSNMYEIIEILSAAGRIIRP
ncbi:MAG: sulfurtransferase-like selenium metabolism protein YedF [bacterium]|nr:sulfurtransferase-like selenium metabolism protein YedF [bacterium]